MGTELRFKKTCLYLLSWETLRLPPVEKELDNFVWIGWLGRRLTWCQFGCLNRTFFRIKPKVGFPGCLCVQCFVLHSERDHNSEARVRQKNKQKQQKTKYITKELRFEGKGDEPSQSVTDFWGNWEIYRNGGGRVLTLWSSPIGKTTYSLKTCSSRTICKSWPLSVLITHGSFRLPGEKPRHIKRAEMILGWHLESLSSQGAHQPTVLFY